MTDPKELRRLMGQFATNMQQRIAAIERGESTADLGGGQASGFAIGLRAAQLALMRVIRRFFMPYDPSQFPSRGGA